MWFDADGAVNTREADPNQALSSRARSFLDQLNDEQRDELINELAWIRESFFDQVNAGRISAAANESTFEDRVFPYLIETPPDGDMSKLVDVLVSINDRWRLDVALTLEDYLYRE